MIRNSETEVTNERSCSSYLTDVYVYAHCFTTTDSRKWYITELTHTQSPNANDRPSILYECICYNVNHPNLYSCIWCICCTKYEQSMWPKRWSDQNYEDDNDLHPTDRGRLILHGIRYLEDTTATDTLNSATKNRGKIIKKLFSNLCSFAYFCSSVVIHYSRWLH